MSRRITLLNEDHEWLVSIVESMQRKAKKDAAIWCDHLDQIDRIKNALYTADPGFDELFPEEMQTAPDGNAQKKATRRSRKVEAKTEKRTAPPIEPPPTKPGPVKVTRAPAKKVAAPVVEDKKPRAKRGERLATLPKLCEEHPAYGAVRMPRTDCKGCWAAYEKLNPNTANLARAKFNRKNK